MNNLTSTIALHTVLSDGSDVARSDLTAPCSSDSPGISGDGRIEAPVLSWLGGGEISISLVMSGGRSLNINLKCPLSFLSALENSTRALDFLCSDILADFRLGFNGECSQQ